MRISKRNVVKQSYELNNARYKLSAVETDIIMKMIAEIKNEDQDFKSYCFRVTELEKSIGRTLDRSSLKETARNLMKKPLSIDEGQGDWLVCNWVSSFRYRANIGEIEISFDPKLKPYLLELQSHFVKADVRYIFQLTSEYAKRLYTIFKQWEKIGTHTVEVSEWQKTLQVPKTQLMYGEFKRKVIEVAKDQINSKTDLEVSYKEIKTGRKITHIEWEIKKRAGQQMLITDVSKETINTSKVAPWIKEKREKRKKGQEMAEKIAEMTGGGNIFDLIGRS